MRTKVAVDELKYGMYVSGLDRPGKAPFLFRGFEITNDGQLSELKRRCRYVYIDDAYDGRAVKANPAARTLANRSVEARPKPRLRVVAEKRGAVSSRPLRADTTHVEQEAPFIRETYDEAAALIRTIMEDVHHGKRIDTEGAKRVVAAMAKSVLRNADALVGFTQLKKREEYTALHCLRVCILALVFGRHLGFEEEKLNLLGLGALLHDVGKMRVPDAILNKPGKLDEREYEIMKGHVPMGVEVLQRTGAIPPEALQLAREHHERYAGHGYMEKRRGYQISQFGLIGAIVDVYDAMTSDRAYKDGIAPLDALRKMYGWGQRDFHPELLEQFIQCIGVFPIGSVVLLNTGEVGVVRTLNRQQRLKPQVVVVLQPDKRPYPVLRAVDLVHDTAPTGGPYAITKVVPGGMFNLRAVDYLPVGKGI